MQHPFSIVAMAVALVFAVATGGLAPAHAQTAAPSAPGPAEPPLVLTADEVRYDQNLDIVTATGNVEVSREGRLLVSDTLNYNQKTNVVTASGNVRLVEPDGNVLFADYMELTGDFRDGIARDLRMLMADNSRFAASGARRSGGRYLEMRNGVYSPCDLCETDPERPPLWQVKAVRVVHDEQQQTIEYSDAWLELAGIPVLYTPYLSHPDPTVKRKSGLLAPRFGASTDLGTIVGAPYFYVIDDYSDVTVEPIVTSKEGPVLAGEHRARLQNGQLTSRGSITQDSSDDIRGDIKSVGLFNIDETWRWGFDVARASDDTYQRRYGFPTQRTLTSEGYVEGFRQRNYMALRSAAYQDLSSLDNNSPLVLPMAEYAHVGEPNHLGAYTTLDVLGVALSRNEGVSSRHVSTIAGWHVPYVSPIGEIYTLSTTLQGDAYHVSNVPKADGSGSDTGATGRLFPQVALDWRLPLVRSEPKVYQVLEPMVSLVAAPTGGNPDMIPNEDSVDFILDDTNLFSPNRFTGTDRVDNGVRVNYATQWSAHAPTLGRTSAFIGQSYQIRQDRDTFPQDAGLDDKLSDIVTRAQISPSSYFNLLGRARLDNESLAVQSNEIISTIGPPALRLSANYGQYERQRLGALASREELLLSLAARLSRYWTTTATSITDLTEGGGTRALGLGLKYEDECFLVTTTISRSFYQDRDLRPSDTILLRVFFKTLGDFTAQVF